MEEIRIGILRVGMVIYGYCGGVFGRDSYEDKRVEGMGADWVVARGIKSGNVYLYEGIPEDLLKYQEVKEE